MNSELENELSCGVVCEKMDLPSKRTHLHDKDEKEDKMEVAVNIDAPTYQIVVQQELQLLPDPQGVICKEAAQPLAAGVESVTVPPVALVSPSEESTSCSKEQLITERLHEEIEQKENSEFSTEFMDFEMTSAVESCVKDGLCLGDKSLKLPTEVESSFSPDIGKTNVSSSPTLRLDLPSHNMLHSYSSTLNSSGNIMPTTYISVTPKIGMGKPAITKRKFSPGRPRSKQVG